MALTPLHVQVIDSTGAPAPNQPIELRRGFAPQIPVPGYNVDGTEMTPIETEADGEKVIWLPNSLVEWRANGTLVTGWRAFRAYAGYGAEGIFEDSLSMPVSMDAPVPVLGSPATLDTITVPSFGVDDKVGLVAVTVDFAFSNMWDLKLTLVDPSSGSGALWQGPSSLSSSANDYAFDGAVTFVSEGGDDNYDVPMVDGGTYTISVIAGRGSQASGVWTLKWEGAIDPLDFSGHTGELRSWSIEFIPD